MDKVAADLDVRAVDDGKVGSNFLDEGNQARHLRIIFGRVISHAKKSDTRTDANQ